MLLRLLQGFIGFARWLWQKCADFYNSAVEKGRRFRSCKITFGRFPLLAIFPCAVSVIRVLLGLGFLLILEQLSRTFPDPKDFIFYLGAIPLIYAVVHTALDIYDGRLARQLRVDNEFGAFFDVLCDLWSYFFAIGYLSIAFRIHYDLVVIYLAGLAFSCLLFIPLVRRHCLLIQLFPASFLFFMIYQGAVKFGIG